MFAVPTPYVSSENFFLDLREVALALPDPSGSLVVYLKNAINPVVINCDAIQSQAIVTSLVGWTHYENSK